LLASRIQQVQSFQVVVQFFVLPMFFLSGAVFPLTRLPAWLRVLTRLDPLSYAVDAMRRAVFAHISASPSANQTLNRGITWGDWRVPVGVEIGLVALLGAVALALAVVEFSRAE
jgi:ABC-2 type transport system permease protein